MGLLEGNKMSSSKGNVVLLSDAMRDNGSDVVRLFLMSNAEPWQDFDWRENLVKNTGRKLKQFFDQVNYFASITKEMPERDIDRWLIGRMHESIDKTSAALEGFQTRKALQASFFDLLNDLLWYTRRCEPNAKTLKEFSEAWIKLLAPFTPFTCEELWERTGHKGFVSLEKYPVKDLKKINPAVSVKEEMVKQLMEDLQHILEISKIKPKTVHIYLAPDWKRQLFCKIKEGMNIGEVMKDAEMKRYGKEVPSIMQKYRKDEVPDVVLSLDDEAKTLEEARSFLEKEFSTTIDIQKTATKDPENKARFAMPMKPGIYVE